MIISSGTSLAVIGVGDETLIGAALFYLVGSTLASCALYLLAELIERSRAIDAAPPIREHESDRLPFRLETQDRSPRVRTTKGGLARRFRRLRRFSVSVSSPAR